MAFTQDGSSQNLLKRNKLLNAREDELVFAVKLSFQVQL